MRIVVERNLRVRMRDGVELAADLYRPDIPAPLPTILHRTPYGKNEQAAGRSLDALRLVEGGFNLLVQDTRGRFGSGGRFTPFQDDGDDGSDTVAWIAGQPWSTPAVGMVGRSYGGLTQWLAATAVPAGASIAALAPDVTTANLYDGWTYQGGAFQLGFCLYWTLEDLAAPVAGRVVGPEAAELLAHVDSIDELYREPWRALPLLDRLAPYYREWLEHPRFDEHWRRLSPSERLDRVEAPSLTIGGWYDVFVAGTVSDYARLRRHAATPAARERSRLVVGPWAHLLRDGVYPERRLPSRASHEAVDVTELHRRWFDATLNGVGDGSGAARVEVFVLGADRWEGFDDWPPPEAGDVRLFLHSGGRANGSGGDGVLSEEHPSEERPDVFLYDPRSPVPTHGGATLLPRAAVGGDCGPLDQREVEERPDVLCYTSAPLDAPLAVVGDVTAFLYASSSAVDTDFTAKLVDVHPGGRAEILCDGILRGRHRESFSEATPMKPGEIYEFRIAVGPIANLFSRGHRIRLEVSSSNFPRFDPNPNTDIDSPRLGPVETVPAVNSVHHERSAPSRLVLAVVDWPR